MVLIPPVGKVWERSGHFASASRYVRFPDLHQVVWFAERQRAKQQGIDDTEDCGVSADAERQRDYCNGGEARMFDKSPNTIADVLQYGFHQFLPDRSRIVEHKYPK